MGLSRNPKDFSRMLFRDLRQRGYEVIPVNPSAIEIENTRCFAGVQEIDPPVQGALLLTAPKDTERAVQDCAAAGIRNIWMYRAGGQGSLNPSAIEFCREYGINLVEGYCPYMFFSHTAIYHRIHAIISRITGAYPAKQQSAA